MLTNVIPWALIKRCRLDLLEQCVRSDVAIEQDPYFWSEAINYNPYLKTITLYDQTGLSVL